MGEAAGDKSDFDEYKDESKLNKFLIDGTFEQSILTGLTLNYGGGRTYSEVIYDKLKKDAPESLLNRELYTDGARPSKGGMWIDYVHVFQPPTEYSWGYGKIYMSGRKGVTYLTIPMAPFSLISSDISAKFDTLPKEALAGEKVRVGVSVNSTFPDPVTTEYEWNITSGGTKLTSQEHGLIFVGQATSESGTIQLTRNQSKVLYAEFTMPATEVRIQFSVNNDGKEPEETILGNNKLDSNQKAIKVIVPKGLGYDTLSIKDKFPLRNNALTAALKLPFSDAYWTGPATGKLNIHNDTPTLFRNHKEWNNPKVNEESEVISRSPSFEAVIKREDFGDDPLNKKWKNQDPAETPIKRDGTVSYDGNVQRNYEYEDEECSTNAEGETVCEDVTKKGTASAPFEEKGTDQKYYDVYVYNGKNLEKQTFLKQINSNTRSSFSKKMLWENEPYTYNVIRWMYHLDENGKAYVPNGVTPDADDFGVAVPGQYPRVFTQQASADITWSAESKMSEEYAGARQAAKDRKNNKKLYDKAVFATDKELQKFAYPIKSGYYYNPAGSYTFTVKTVMYKQSTADTKDHKDLVDSLIHSFRYESNLVYINNMREPVNIANGKLTEKGGGFKIEPGILTAKDPKGVNGKVLLEVLDRSTGEDRYTKEWDEIEYSMQKTGKMHDYWKMVLEGYSQSSSADSFAKYKYREYVGDGQKKMYKITETTKVTINMNPDNIPL